MGRTLCCDGSRRKSSSRRALRSRSCKLNWIAAQHPRPPNAEQRGSIFMNPCRIRIVPLCLGAFASATAVGGQAPGAATAPDIPISSRDRVYLSDQTSNTVSVLDPSTDKLLGVIRLGDPAPGNLSPLYRGQLLVHGMGLSPDHRTLIVVSIGSNSVTFIDTASNRLKHTSYVGRSPHEAMYTPDGKEV